MVKTNYKNLTGFITIKKLNKRQVYWAGILKILQTQSIEV